MINIPYVLFDYAERIILRNQTVVQNNETTIVTEITVQRSCTPSQELSNVLDIINVLMRSYLPFSIMLVLNIILTKAFLKSKKKALKNDGMRKEYYFTFTVITMNITFFIVYTPWSLYYIINRIVQANPFVLTPLFSAQLGLFQTLSFSLAYVNNFTSFFLNIIFNNLFRNEVLSIFKRKNDRTVITSKTPIIF